MANLTVEMAQRGQVTIPRALLERHEWHAGQQFAVLDLGDAIVMCPKVSRIDTPANELRDDLLQDGATLDHMLTELREVRGADGL